MEQLISPELSPVTQGLLQRAQADILQRYGSGEVAGLEPNHQYHNADHTTMVVDTVELLAQAALAAGKITPREREILLVAAAYHDYEHSFGTPPGQNEDRSAQAAVAHMQETGSYSVEEMARVERIIMATVTKSEGGIRLVQNLDPQEALSPLMLDADLSRLGQETPVFMEISGRLFQEFNQGEAAEGPKWRTFLANQVQLLRGHQFHTPEAAALLPHQEANAQHIENLLRNYPPN